MVLQHCYMLSSPLLASIRRRHRHSDKVASSPSFSTARSTSESTTVSSTMGNTQSTQSSPRRKPAPVSRSSTTSSTPHMPGSEAPPAVPNTEEQGLPRLQSDPVSYTVQIDVQDDGGRLGDLESAFASNDSRKNDKEAAHGDASGVETPRPIPRTEEMEAQQIAVVADTRRGSANLNDLEAGLITNSRDEAEPNHPLADEVEAHQDNDAHHASNDAHHGHEDVIDAHSDAHCNHDHDTHCDEQVKLHHTWSPGTYVLLNAKSGTALDLSGANQRALIGFPVHMGQNQQWEFIPSGRGYAIRSACPSMCGLYLTIDSSLCEHAAIIASPFPASWNIEPDECEGTLRISWPNTDYVIDLADWGSSVPGTKVQLMKAKPGECCQLWRFTRCAPAQDQEEKVARSAFQPVVSETVIISESSDFVTTTRTATTTTVTTVTTVTKTTRLGAGVAH
ncbi:hypothetical protein AcW1_003256 [Taiwanofungus camphoratus]|nr:hypothetical protein AcW1_003256 [Antrodia cinnamomea]